MASAHRYTWTRQPRNGRPRADGSAWRAKWIDGEGKPRSKRGFELERSALQYAQDREAEGRHGVTLPDEEELTGRMTLSAWSKVWLEGLAVKEQTLDAYGYALKRILPTLGGRTLVGLRPSEVKAWRRGLQTRAGKPLAESTAEATMAVLSMMLRAAVQDGLLEKSPLGPYRGGDGPAPVDPDEILTVAQVRVWCAAMPPWAADMPLVAAMTGLRQGELLGLRVESVDFLRRTIRVREQLVTPKGKGGPVFGPPKTAAGVRTVPLPLPAAEALARHLERYPAVDGEPIFRGSRGQRWRRGTFGDVWRKARTEAKLPAWAHWHSLRDVYASSLIRSGQDVTVVMRLMGHTSSEETFRVYARLWPDATDRARQAVEGLWSEPEGHGRATEDGTSL